MGSRYIRVHASNFKNSDSENEDHPLRTSGSKDLRHPVKSLHGDEIDLDATMISKEDSEEEEYDMVTGANRQLHGQSLRNLQSLIDTT